MPVGIHIFALGSRSLLTWRLLLFPLLPFLFLLLLRGRLLALRRRWLGRCGRRRALLLLLALRRLRSLSRSWLVSVRLCTIVWLRRGRTIRLGPVIGLIRLGTIVWLCRGRTIRLGAVIGLIRLGTIVRLCRRRTIRLGAVIGLIRLGPIVWLCRRRTIRFGAIVRLRWCRLISRPVCRLVSGRIGGGLTRTPSIWLVSGLIAWLVCRTAGIWCGRFARRRHFDHRLRSRCSRRRTQRLYFVLRQRLS